MDKSIEMALLYRLSEIISFAEYLPMEMISKRNTEPIYPVTIGELLVSYGLDIALHQDQEWKSELFENVVDSIVSILGQLDMGVDRPDVWRELFAANTELKELLRQK